MTSPRRLIDTSDNQLTRSLLQAGQKDVANAEFGQRLLVGLGVAGAVTSVSVAAAAGGGAAAAHGVAASGSGATSLALVAAKWVAVGVLGGGILAGTAELVFTPRPSPPVLTQAVRPQPALPRPTSARAQPVTMPVEALATPSAAPSSAPPTPVKVPGVVPSAEPSGQRGQLGREVRAIDHARQLLASGNFSEALLELDAFDRTANTGVLDREARVLRIETLYKLGSLARARALRHPRPKAPPVPISTSFAASLVHRSLPQRTQLRHMLRWKHATAGRRHGGNRW
jgi:hypothetical protein